jgi:hypothetical protein
MRSCPNCGVPNAESDEFCGNCGTYLDWLPENAGRPPRPDAAQPAAAAAQPAAVEPDAVQPDAVGADAVEPAAAAGADAARPAAADRSGADQPGAVQPARPVAPRPPPVTATWSVAGDGPPCRVCGTPNATGRRFCRHCGSLLAPPAPAPRRAWWRRLRLPRVGLSSTLLRRLVALAVLGALAVAGVLLYPHGRNLVQDVRDKRATPQQVRPTSVTADAAVPRHPAAAAADGATNRYWGAPRVGDSVDFAFAHPFRLLTLVIHTGASTDPDQFGTQARPTRLQVTAITASGQRRTIQVDLADHPGPQEHDTGLGDVVRVHVVIQAAAGLTRGRHIALGEVEFFGR